MSTSEYSKNTFRDGGKMGALMLQHDWSTSPLGYPGKWPSSLRSAVSLLLGSNFPMFLAWGDELGFLYNDAYSVLLDKKHPAALGAKFADVWQEIWDDIYPLITAALSGQSIYRENLPLFVNRSGFNEKAWFTFSYSPVRDDNGQVVGVFCAVVETTDQVLANKRSDFRLKLHNRMRAAKTSRMVLDFGCQLLGEEMNAAFCTFSEIYNDEVTDVQSAWLAPELTLVKDRHKLANYSAARSVDLFSGNPVLIEDVRADPRTAGTVAEDGYASLGCRATLEIPLSRNGAVTALLGIGTVEPHVWTKEEVALATETIEIMWQSAERARAETRLSESEVRFRAMADNAPTMVWVTDENGYCTYLNRAWYEFTGQTVEEAEGFGWLNATHPEDQQMANDIFLAANAKSEPFRIEYRLKNADGGYRWAIDAAAPRLGDEGQFLGYIGSVVDIHERRIAEHRLAESEAKYRMLFDSIDEGFCIIEFVEGPNGELDDYIHIELNVAYAANAGISDAIGTSVRDLIGHEADEWIKIYRKVLETGEPVRFERKLLATNRYLELSAFRLEPPEKRQVATLFKDVTARKVAEEDLVKLNSELATRIETAVAQRATALAHLHEAQKLETLGHLTGGVAHDFNNLLTPIVGAFDLLARRPELNDRGKMLVQGGALAAEKARLLVQRLLAFSRRQTLESRPVDIRRVVADMSDLIERSIGRHIDLDIECGEDALVATVDPNQFELALLNLAVNARDAMPAGGHLKISVNGITSQGKPLLSDGDYVCVRVSDTGAGMDEETMRRAIEPFFTTKGIGQGTGLGLPSVHGLAAQSGGLFELDSELGKGTTASLWLPTAQPVAVGHLEHVDSSFGSHKPEDKVILLVDDDILVRMGTAQMLQDIGYTVIEAPSARQALQIIKNGAALDMLVTDYAMPEMTGDKLAMHARKLRPDLKLLLVTGYSSVESKMVIEMRRLQKPFGQADLDTAVAAVFGSA